MLNQGGAKLEGIATKEPEKPAKSSLVCKECGISNTTIVPRIATPIYRGLTDKGIWAIGKFTGENEIDEKTIIPKTLGKWATTNHLDQHVFTGDIVEFWIRPPGTGLSTPQIKKIHIVEEKVRLGYMSSYIDITGNQSTSMSPAQQLRREKLPFSWMYEEKDELNILGNIFEHPELYKCKCDQ